MSLSIQRPSQNIKDKLLQDVQNIDEPKKRLNLDIEISLHRRIKAYCAMENKTIADITRQLWIEHLNE